MADPFPFREIPLAAVDLEDHTFVVPGGDLTRLLSSMQEVGLLNPPWLRARPEARWQVVTGLKRLRVAAELGWQSLPARLLPTATPESYCLLVALYDNAFTRGFHLWEQAILTRRLLDYWDRATVAAKFLPYLGLPPSAAHLDRLLKVSTLDPPFQELCARGRLALTTAATLAQWPAADRAAALPYLADLPFTQSKQEQFLEDVEILARREGVSAGEILLRQTLAQLLHAPDPNPTARAEAVRQLLRRWVNPRLSAAQDAFQKGLGRLGLKGHTRIHLQPPPAFEGPDFHLEIKFKDVSELKNLLEEIARLTVLDNFANLTRL
ncbi:MAG: ParB N-terminal domain-containing protein [Deltaproteobacteria bacterium]|nr:ParB N-terminal domain-containing protein [Deltaproteobacteria bacterium]